MRKTNPDVPRVYVIEKDGSLLLTPGFFLTSGDAYAYIDKHYGDRRGAYCVTIISSEGVIR